MKVETAARTALATAQANATEKRMNDLQKRYPDRRFSKVFVAIQQGLKICPDCSPYDGKVFGLREGPKLPKHPNCRCTYVPQVENVTVTNSSDGLEAISIASPIEFTKGQAYPARSQKLDDVLTEDLGLVEFHTVETITRNGARVVVRGLSGPAERAWLEGIFDEIPSAHWRSPIAEVRITNRRIYAWSGDEKVRASGVYTPSDKGIYLRRNGDLQEVRETFFHEYGHHWLEHISIGSKARIYEETAKKLDLTLYAKERNYQEFWANAYQARILSKNTLKLMYPEVHALIEETENEGS